MRLLDFGQKEDYQPLDRGEALPQFYENGDRYAWRNDWEWHWPFWYFLQSQCRYHPGSPSMADQTSMLLMGGEL